MHICIKGLVVSMSNRYGVIYNGAIVIDGVKGVIVDIGDESILNEYICDYIEGGKGYVILPGFINTHTHIPMIVLQGFATVSTGFDWLKTIWFLEGLLRPRDIYVASKMGIVTMLENGITTFSDHYFYEEEVARAVEELGIRAVLAKSVIDYSEYVPRHTIDDSARFALRYRGSAEGRITTMLGVHALYSCSEDTLRKAVEYSLENDIRIHMHFSESLHEIEYIRNRYSSTPTEFAERIALLKTRPLLAHATYLSDKDIEILSRYELHIAYSPFTIMSWGQDIARILELLEKNINVALATNGPVTSGDMCLFKEMKIALAAQSSKYRRPIAISPKNILEMTTNRAAIALGLGDLVGSLEPGKKADILILKMRLSRSIGLYDDPYHAIVYNMDCRDIYSVYVNGRKLVEYGKAIGVDIDRLYSEVYEIRERLLEEIHK